MKSPKMAPKYNSSEKIWSSEKLNINLTNTNLGRAIMEKLDECCQKNPNRVLEVYHENGLELTVKDIRSKTIAVLENLIRIGVKKGDTLIFFSRVNEKITPITFACYILGVAINFFDIFFEDDETQYIFELIDPVVILYEEDFKDKVDKAVESTQLTKLKCLLNFNLVDEVLFKKSIPEEDTQGNFQPPDLVNPFELPAILAFTSGSTGMPKLAIHSHAMVLQGLYNGWWDLSPGSVISIFSDLRWICQTEMMLQPVFFEAKRVFCFRQEKDISTEYLFEMIHFHGLTHCYTAPMSYLDMLNYLEQWEDRPSFEKLKTVMLIGEVVADSLLSKSKKLLPHCKLIQCYGMTELPGMVASNEFVREPNSKAMIVNNGFLLKIVDRQGQSMGPNEMGTLLFKSEEAPILGYFKNEEANKMSLMEDGWFNTHDRAFMDENNLLNVVVREKFLLHASGITIIPNDVENIVNCHSNVNTSALIGHPNPANLMDQLGTIFIALNNDTNSDLIKEIESDLKKLLLSKLTKDQLKIVKYLKTIPEMPITKCFKTDRKYLTALASEISSNNLIDSNSIEVRVDIFKEKYFNHQMEIKLAN